MRLNICNIRRFEALALASLLAACTPATSEEEHRAREGEEQDGGSQEQESGESETTADIPVPIFLVDPETMLTMVGNMGAISPAKTGPEQLSQGLALPESVKDEVAAESQTFGTMVESSFVQLIKVMQLVVVEQFGGQTLAVPGGAHVFAVREDLTARSDMLPKLVKVQVIEPAPVDRYALTFYCGAGLANGEVRECAKVNFRPSEIDRNKGIVSVAGWSHSDAVETAFEFVLEVDYQADTLLAGMRRAKDAEFDVGIEFLGSPASEGIAAEILRVATYRRTVPSLPALDFLNNITFGRNTFLVRQIGDVLAYETAVAKDKSLIGRVQQFAFLPTDVFVGFADGVLPHSIFEEHSTFSYAKVAFFINARSPDVNLSCDQMGTLLTAAYGTDPVPTEVASVPANICNTTTIPNEDVIFDGLVKFCADGKRTDISIRLSKEPGPFSILPMNVCDLFPIEKPNPGYFDGLITEIIGAPLPHMVELKSLIDTYSVYMRTDDTFGRLNSYDLSPAILQVSSVK